MKKTWKRQLALTVAAAVATVSAGAIVPAAASATTTRVAARTQTATAAPAAAALHYGRLYAMYTPAHGLFYTVGKKNVYKAEKGYGFKLSKVFLGYVRSRGGSGTFTLYRLRVTKGSNYIVTISKTEAKKLAASPKFVYEGVLGHTYAHRHSRTAHLWRLNNGHVWEITNTTHAKYLMHHHWHLDGQLGWVKY